MFEKVDKCPVCDHHDIKNFLICQDHFNTKESFAITRCAECSFLFTNPRPDQTYLSNYYKSDEYISHSDKAINITQYLYKIVRKYTLNQKLKLINSLSDKKEILDFGCGTGNFLSTCKKNKWKILGVEPEDSARMIAEKHLQSKIYKSITELDNNIKLPVITLWHVLEHVPDLNETIDNLKNILSKNGHLILAVPNWNCYDQYTYREYWAAYDVPRHLYHFTQETMSKLTRKHKMKIKKTLPMKFDSFYVSLLSEFYKNGHHNYIKSMINGYKSNIYASKNNNNYSSLIYIISK